MKIEIRNLRKKLPARGYIKLVQQEAKASFKTKLTQDQISNFFSGDEKRPVSEEAQDAIIDASKNVIRNIQKQKEARRRRATLV